MHLFGLQGEWILAGGHEYDEAWIQGLRQPVEEQGGEADTGDRGGSCQVGMASSQQLPV